MRRILTGLLLLTLVTGCVSRPAQVLPPVAPGPVAAAPTVPGEVAPTPQPVHRSQVPTRKLAVDDVTYVVVSDGEPAGRSALLWPSTHAREIAALINALNTVEQGVVQMPPHPPRLRAEIHMKQPGKNGTGVLLQVIKDSGSLYGAWNDPWMYFDSPAVARALADLEPLMQPMPKPGTRVWAVDPTGSKPPELLVDQKPLRLRAFSPDGRYWLLNEDLGVYKGDYTAVPYLLDRTTGVLRESARTEIRGDVTWSGSGFFINWPAHLGLDLKEERFPALRDALGLKPDGRRVVDFSLAGDGSRFAAIIGDPWRETELDLVLGKLDGTGITVLAKAVSGVETQSGHVGRVALSPDGGWLGLIGKDLAAIVRVADVSAPQRWTKVQGSLTGEAMSWSPDSQHLYVPSGQIYDRTGKAVQNSSSTDRVVWRPDGKAAVLQTGAQVQILGMDGSRTDVPVPDRSVPLGFLPDGRLLVFDTIYPGQQ